MYGDIFVPARIYTKKAIRGCVKKYKGKLEFRFSNKEDYNAIDLLYNRAFSEIILVTAMTIVSYYRKVTILRMHAFLADLIFQLYTCPADEAYVDEDVIINTLNGYDISSKVVNRILNSYNSYTVYAIVHILAPTLLDENRTKISNSFVDMCIAIADFIERAMNVDITDRRVKQRDGFIYLNNGRRLKLTSLLYEPELFERVYGGIEEREPELIELAEEDEELERVEVPHVENVAEIDEIENIVEKIKTPKKKEIRSEIADRIERLYPGFVSKHILKYRNLEDLINVLMELEEDYDHEDAPDVPEVEHLLQEVREVNKEEHDKKEKRKMKQRMYSKEVVYSSTKRPNNKAKIWSVIKHEFSPEQYEPLFTKPFRNYKVDELYEIYEELREFTKPHREVIERNAKKTKLKREKELRERKGIKTPIYKAKWE